MTEADILQRIEGWQHTLAQGRRIYSGGRLCASCVFWQPEEHLSGRCYRFPQDQQKEAFDWCGEHQHVPDFSEALAREEQEAAAA